MSASFLITFLYPLSNKGGLWSMSRGMVERDRDIEERRVAEMAEKLSVYKREVGAHKIQFNLIVLFPDC